MFITTENEIKSLMPTAKWNRPQQLFGYIEEEERVALEPLLGTALYQFLLLEYDRLRDEYTDITATTVRSTGKVRHDPRLAHADVTEMLEQIHSGNYRMPYAAVFEEETDVSEDDFLTIRLIRICQQIEFYKMLAHKAGLLTVSFNEGGGMNTVNADGYDEASEKSKDRVVKDAWMSAGRAVDSLLLFLEADAKGKRLFTEKWGGADAYYLHKDLLFQTARVLNEYLDIKGERMAYVQLVRDIRFCQNTYLKPRVGSKLLKAMVDFANEGELGTRLAAGTTDESGDGGNDGGSQQAAGGTDESGATGDAAGPDDGVRVAEQAAVMEELLGMLRTALAFYVESRRISYTHMSMTVSTSVRGTGSSIEKDERLARRDSMTDAQQAMSMACQFIEENLELLGDAAVGTPIYNAKRAREAQEARDKECACKAAERRRREACAQQRKMLFTGFPMTHRGPELK